MFIPHSHKHEEMANRNRRQLRRRDVELWLHEMPMNLQEEENLDLPPSEHEDSIDEDDISTEIFPAVRPVSVFEVSSTTHTPPAIPLARAVVEDEDGISSTRPGRALKWSDPGTAADTDTQEFLECQTLPQPVESWEEALHFSMQEMEELLGPSIDVDDIARNLFAPGEDWVEGCIRKGDALEEQIQDRQRHDLTRHHRFVLRVEGIAFRVIIGRGGLVSILRH